MMDEKLRVLQMCYLKHHLGDDSIGWDELAEALHNVLCNEMGDEEYYNWLDEIKYSVDQQ